MRYQKNPANKKVLIEEIIKWQYWKGGETSWYKGRLFRTAVIGNTQLMEILRNDGWTPHGSRSLKYQRRNGQLGCDHLTAIDSEEAELAIAYDNRTPKDDRRRY